jgi:cell wall-associated NlpC family hydrolase
MIRRAALALLFAGPLAHLPTGPLAAQDISVDLTGYKSENTRTGWRIGLGGAMADPLGYRLFAVHQRSDDATIGEDYGLGADFTLWERGRPGPYLVGGLQSGVRDRVGSDDVAGLDGWWAWSGGVGYELVPVSFLVFRGEGRYRATRPGPEQGVEVSLGLTIRLGSGRAPKQRAVTEERRANAPSAGRMVDLARAEGIEGDKAQLLADVVATATGAMGTPYQWGGTGSNGGGFDCSGLIQYAFRQHGIALPRTSRDQARMGVAVDREMSKLAPGDILTFSNSGGPVTHVALYIGDGKIIHSATGGVQISLLSPTDSYGKWWYKRWVGVRRVVR